MAIFDYITSDEFRKSLESDYQEISRCFDAGAWKAVHVLAGSIIEAVLLDYISAEGFTSHDEALKMDLGTAINLCKDKKVISSRTSDLSSVIKSYRNLIHPGRLIRQQENIDKNSAEVARALVAIVVDEIEKQKRDKYGYTAEQIVVKIRRDSSVDTVISDIIKKANPKEIEKLLMKILPKAYMESSQEFDEIKHLPKSLSICFRTAFEQSSEELRKKVSDDFPRIIKEESDQFLFSYGKLFFRAADMQYLSQEDIEITKKYLLGRLESDPEGWISTLIGIGKYISEGEVNKFTDPLIRIINGVDNEDSGESKKRLIEESKTMSNDLQLKVTARLNDWIFAYRRKRNEKAIAKTENIKSSIDPSIGDIPF
jgi:hypothetical protein